MDETRSHAKLFDLRRSADGPAPPPPHRKEPRKAFRFATLFGNGFQRGRILDQELRKAFQFAREVITVVIRSHAKPSKFAKNKGAEKLGATRSFQFATAADSALSRHSLMGATQSFSICDVLVRPPADRQRESGAAQSFSICDPPTRPRTEIRSHAELFNLRPNGRRRRIRSYVKPSKFATRATLLDTIGAARSLLILNVTPDGDQGLRRAFQFAKGYRVDDLVGSGASRSFSICDTQMPPACSSRAQDQELRKAFQFATWPKIPPSARPLARIRSYAKLFNLQRREPSQIRSRAELFQFATPAAHHAELRNRDQKLREAFQFANRRP
jgi:hypothetical protein